MKKPTSRDWASIALLSVIVPVSLLGAFRLTGVLHEPPKPENITLETVGWNITRPTTYFSFNRHVRNFFIDNVSAGLDIIVISYHENEPGPPSDGNDYVKLYISATANISSGSIYYVLVRFSRTDSDAYLIINTTPSFIELNNLETNAINYLGTDESEAFFETVCVNHLRNCSLSLLSYWLFLDKNNVTHWITATLEVTYLNGETYSKLTIPIFFGVIVD